MFELGLAFALEKRVALIVPEGVQEPPSLGGLLIVHASLENREAIEFSIDQILAAPPLSKHRTEQTSPKPLGDEAEELRLDAAAALAAGNGRSFEEVVARAIMRAGADLVEVSTSPDEGADLAVWADSWESIVGNPLLVEVKLRVHGRSDIERASHQLLRGLSRAPGRWGVLIFGEGPPREDPVWKVCPMNILGLSFHDLFETARDSTFPELIRTLRNRRVHGLD